VVTASITLTELIGLTVYAVSAEALTCSFASHSFAAGFFRVAALAMVLSAAFGVYATWG
jgi:hypothetical protein